MLCCTHCAAAQPAALHIIPLLTLCHSLTCSHDQKASYSPGQGDDEEHEKVTFCSHQLCERHFNYQNIQESHIFQLANNAYYNMQRTGQDQFILLMSVSLHCPLTALRNWPHLAQGLLLFQ